MPNPEKGTVPEKESTDTQDPSTEASEAPNTEAPEESGTEGTGKAKAPEKPSDPKAEATRAKELKELEELRKYKKDAEREKLSEQQRIEAERDEALQALAAAKRDTLIARAQVPDELVDLIPKDLEAAKEFLQSDKYETLQKALKAKDSVESKATEDHKQSGSKEPSKPTSADLGAALAAIL